MSNALSPVHLPALEDLLLLLAVEEHGGVGAAARELGMAQPNASRALHRMERQLGLQLLKRTTTGSTLTPEGALVADWSRRVVNAYSDLRAGVAAISGPQTGPVRVAASQTIAEELLPRWLASLRREYPGIDVHLTVANSEQVGRALNDGGVLGFVESPQLPSTLQVPVRSRRVASDRLVVVVSPDHDWARRTRPVGLAELAATALVVREPGSGTRVSFEQAMDGFELADPALELASNSAVRIAVAAGAAPAVLSELAVRHAVAAGDLRAVMVADFIVERPLQAVWARSPKPRPELLRLVELAALSETPE
jgi:molybdate transport repressor ModE-like protein